MFVFITKNHAQLSLGFDSLRLQRDSNPWPPRSQCVANHSSVGRASHNALKFSRKQGDRVAYLYEKNKSIKLQMSAFTSQLNLTQFITTSKLACSVANSTKSFQININQKQEDIMNGNLELNRHMKNFIRRHEICTV